MLQEEERTMDLWDIYPYMLMKLFPHTHMYPVKQSVISIALSDLALLFCFIYIIFIQKTCFITKKFMPNSKFVNQVDMANLSYTLSFDDLQEKTFNYVYKFVVHYNLHTSSLPHSFIGEKMAVVADIVLQVAQKHNMTMFKNKNDTTAYVYDLLQAARNKRHEETECAKSLIMFAMQK